MRPRETVMRVYWEYTGQYILGDFTLVIDLIFAKITVENVVNLGKLRL
jgi:hypothetical protein